MNSRRALLFYAAAGVLCAAARAVAPAAGPRAVIDGAVRTVGRLRERLGRAYGPLLDRAKAVLIAPAGNAGDAVLLMQTRGAWSEPAFFSGAALSGKAPAVLLIMSERALDAVLRQQGLVLEGPGALSVAPLAGKGAAAGELLLWPAGRIDADGFLQDDAANAAWYGAARSAPEIVGGTAPDARTARLREALKARPGAPPLDPAGGSTPSGGAGGRAPWPCLHTCLSQTSPTA